MDPQQQMIQALMAQKMAGGQGGMPQGGQMQHAMGSPQMMPNMGGQMGMGPPPSMMNTPPPPPMRPPMQAPMPGGQMMAPGMGQ